MPTSRQQKRLEAQRKIIQHFEDKIPYFTDIFDERTFYISFACLCVFCIILAVFLSICCRVTIHDADELNRMREERKRLKKKKLAEKLLRKKLAKAGIDPNKMDPVKRARLEKLLDQLTTPSDNERDKDLSDLEEEVDVNGINNNNRRDVNNESSSNNEHQNTSKKLSKNTQSDDDLNKLLGDFHNQNHHRTAKQESKSK